MGGAQSRSKDRPQMGWSIGAFGTEGASAGRLICPCGRVLLLGLYYGMLVRRFKTDARVESANIGLNSYNVWPWVSLFLFE